jgi:hypothetical protein
MGKEELLIILAKNPDKKYGYRELAKKAGIGIRTALHSLELLRNTQEVNHSHIPCSNHKEMNIYWHKKGDAKNEV